MDPIITPAAALPIPTAPTRRPVSVLWFNRKQYKQLPRYIEDAAALPTRFEEWRRLVDGEMRTAILVGRSVRPVPFIVNEFRDWISRRGLPPTLDSARAWADAQSERMALGSH